MHSQERSSNVKGSRQGKTGGEYIDAGIDDSAENDMNADGTKGDQMKLPTETELHLQKDKLVDMKNARGGSHKIIDQEIEEVNKLIKMQQNKNQGYNTDIQVSPIDEHIDDPNQQEEMYVPDNIFGQFWLCIKLSVGPIVSMIFYMIVQLINTYYVGHTNESVLIAGVGMGNMLINVLAFATMQGMNGALETLISQAFGASKNKEETEQYRRGMRHSCGVYYNRGRFVVTCLMVPLVVIFALSESILVGIKQDPGVSRIAKTYCCIMIPGVWSMGQFDATKKFLSAQLKTKIPVVVQIVTTLLHFGWCHLFVKRMGMREVGAALATNITYILNMIVADIWIRMLKDGEFQDMVFWYDKTMLKDLCSYLKIGLSGMLMLCFEWWAFEFLAIFTGLLGVDQLAAEVVIINMITFIFMLPLGISYTASALTGNFVGEKKIDLAKRFATLTIVLDVILTSIIVLLLGLYQAGVSSIFTQEPNVIGIIRMTLWTLLIYIWFDTIHGVQSGIIRGLGLQAWGFMYTLFCYYIIGMPLALVLAFTAEMGIVGLWLGYSIACIILDIGFAFIIMCPDWGRIGEQMRLRLEEGREVPSSPMVAVRKALSQSNTPKGTPPRRSKIDQQSPKFHQRNMIQQDNRLNEPFNEGTRYQPVEQRGLNMLE